MITLTQVNTGVGAGGSGSATNNATSTEKVSGELLGFQVTYYDSPPGATTDVTIQAVNGPLGTRTLLALTDTATSGWYPVRQQAKTTAGADATGFFDKLPLYLDNIKVTIAQANDGDYAIVTAVLEAWE